jgi:sec-independent protein translocase protein TatB
MFPEDRFVEILIIGALALIVIGPKDLPILMRRIGQFVGKMRGMAAEFRASFDELARQSELDELRKEVNALRTGQYIAPVASEIDGHFESLHREFGAPPPPALTHEGTITPGPDAVLQLEGPAPVEAESQPTHAPSTAVAPDALAAMAAPSILPPPESAG